MKKLISLLLTVHILLFKYSMIYGGFYISSGPCTTHNFTNIYYSISELMSISLKTCSAVFFIFF